MLYYILTSYRCSTQINITRNSYIVLSYKAFIHFFNTFLQMPDTERKKWLCQTVRLYTFCWIHGTFLMFSSGTFILETWERDGRSSANCEQIEIWQRDTEL